MPINEVIETSNSPPLSCRVYPVKKSTYTLISQIAYLIGVPRRIFENIHEPPKLAIYTELEQNKNARIIRSLCCLRMAIILNYQEISTRMKFDNKPLFAIPDLVPEEHISQLRKDSIDFIKINKPLIWHQIEINRLISDRINNCKELFPLWINWSYLRKLFIMPDGLSEDGNEQASQLYYANKKYYPYQVYVNWNPADEGNILYSDAKFTALLYQLNGDRFSDSSKVTDIGEDTRTGIYDFIRVSGKTVLMVDCENSDVYKLCAALQTMAEDVLGKIEKVILFDDVHTTATWDMLDGCFKIPVEHLVIERVKQEKSLVDIRLTGGTFREFYQNHVDSFILATSDSDYWGLISALPEARFLVLAEREKCGVGIREALSESDIFYCYLDDFYSGGAESLKVAALVRDIRSRLDRAVQLNVISMLESACRSTRVQMSELEKQQFFNRYIKPMHIEIENDGSVRIELQKK
jgi:hypothetical protein